MAAKTSVINEIKGTWKLISIGYTDAYGDFVNLYGNSPNGILVYDNKGYMNAQISNGSRKPMRSGNLSEGSNNEKAEAFSTYMAYYGRYFEREPGVIIHEVEDCLIPNWKGEQEVRYVAIDGDMLYISTPPTEIGQTEVVIEVKWQRV